MGHWNLNHMYFSHITIVLWLFFQLLKNIKPYLVHGSYENQWWASGQFANPWFRALRSVKDEINHCIINNNWLPAGQSGQQQYWKQPRAASKRNISKANLLNNYSSLARLVIGPWVISCFSVWFKLEVFCFIRQIESSVNYVLLFK